jgi:predicted RNA-binding Zn-ribbon protein involved in translation (DUF1610 family)
VSDPQPAAYQCPRCGRVAPWTDGQSRAAGDETDEIWCQNCGAETPLTACAPTPIPAPVRWAAPRAGWYQIGAPAPRYLGNPPEPFTAESGGQQTATWVTLPLDPEDFQ